MLVLPGVMDPSHDRTGVPDTPGLRLIAALWYSIKST
jgi:hypothetical protein